MVLLLLDRIKREGIITEVFPHHMVLLLPARGNKAGNPLEAVSTPHGTSSTGSIGGIRERDTNVSTPHGTSSTSKRMALVKREVKFPHHMVLLLHGLKGYNSPALERFPHHMVLLLQINT